MTNAALGIRTIPLDFDGVTYELSPFDIEDYGRYECWLESNLWAALRRARSQEWITEAEYREYRREAMLVLASQRLSYGTEAYLESCATIPGIREQLRLCLLHKHPDITAEVIDRMVREAPSEVVECLTHINATD